MLNIRPGGQNQPEKDSNPSHWTFLENVKSWSFNCILIHVTACPADKDLPHCHSYYTRVTKQQIKKKLNNQL